MTPEDAPLSTIITHQSKKRKRTTELDASPVASSSYSSSSPSSSPSSSLSSLSSPRRRAPSLIHPFFIPPDKPDVSAAQATAVTSCSSSSPSSSPAPLLTPELMKQILTPTPYYHLTRTQDFDQVMTGTTVTTHPPRRNPSVTLSPSPSSEDYIVIPRFALCDEGQHGPHITDHSVHKQRYNGYWDERLRKLAAQLPDASLYTTLLPILTSPSSSPSSPPPPIFHSLSFYIDGRTSGSGHLSHHTLTALIRLHAGECSPLITRKGTTHVIACNLTLSKGRDEWEKRWGKGGMRGRRLMEVVRPEWVMDSIQVGKRLDEAEYRIVNDRSQPQLNWRTE